MKGIVSVGKYPDGSEDIKVYGDGDLFFQATALPDPGHAMTFPTHKTTEVLIYRTKQGQLKARLQPYGTGFKGIPKRWKW
jgi:hypothetical protein